MNKKGLKMGKSQFSRMLSQVAYIGKMRVRAYGNEPEQIVDAMHEPLISEELFYRVQKLLTSKKVVAAGQVKTKKEEYPLRGFIKCKCCGLKLTASPSKGNGGVYHYYHCRKNCKNERFKASEVNKSFVELLAGLQIQPEISELYYEVVRDVLNANDKERTDNIRSLDKDIDVQKQRIENIQDLYADGGLTQAEWNDMKKRYERSYNDLIMQRTQLSMVRSEFDNYLKWGFTLMGNITDYYLNADVTVKQQIIGSMFSDFFIIDQNKVRTTGTNELVALITRLDAGLKKNKSGQSGIKHKLSAIAESEGFEPSIPLSRYTHFPGVLLQPLGQLSLC